MGSAARNQSRAELASGKGWGGNTPRSGRQAGAPTRAGRGSRDGAGDTTRAEKDSRSGTGDITWQLVREALQKRRSRGIECGSGGGDCQEGKTQVRERGK